jgi:outer membrane protein TolC
LRSLPLRTQTQWHSTEAQRIDLAAGRAQLEHALAVLLGLAPAQFGLAVLSAFSAELPSIPPGLPSRLLARRADIAAAERRVAAANAQIGVAKAAYYPDLSLSATLGFQSSSFANWPSVPNRVWSIGPALVQSLFDGGTKDAQTEQARANFELSVANYRQTVLASFQDVEDNWPRCACWRKRRRCSRSRWHRRANRCG